jgi:ABC-2 type transport system permease protein
MKAIKSEWIKISTVKSFYIVAIFSVLSSLALNFVLVFTNANFQAERHADLVYAPFWSWQGMGSSFVQVALSVFAILAVTNEYSTQTINTSLLATPKRSLLFVSKGLVVSLYAAAVTAIGLLVSFFVTFPFGAEIRNTSSLSEAFMDGIGHGFFAQIAGQVLVCLLFYSIGFILRNSAATIVVYVCVFMILGDALKLISALLNSDTFSRIISFSPSNAYSRFTLIPSENCDFIGGQCFTGEIILKEGSIPDLTWYQGGLTLLAWALVAIVAGFTAFKKCDA